MTPQTLYIRKPSHDSQTQLLDERDEADGPGEGQCHSAPHQGAQGD